MTTKLATPMITIIPAGINFRVLISRTIKIMTSSRLTIALSMSPCGTPPNIKYDPISSSSPLINPDIRDI